MTSSKRPCSTFYSFENTYGVFGMQDRIRSDIVGMIGLDYI